ncbi:MAG: ABC-2 type transport system permease protein [Patiriisocius sp.]|jgi:ABC-2 type transport system permease protein
MKRLIDIELFKLRNTRYFWVLGSLFLTFLILVPVGGRLFLNYLGSIGEVMNGISLGDLPLFDFVDIWQNLTWVYKWFSILLGFIVIISISNEYTYTTLRQGVIDGLSRKDILVSKLGMIFLTSLFFSVVVLLIGLVCGFLWSPVTGMSFIMKNITFVPAYFLHLFAFQLFCLFVGLLVRKSGVSIALVMFYTFVEWIIHLFLRFDFKFEMAAELLPVISIGNLIRLPFAKYGLQETQTYVAGFDVLVVFVYIALLIFGCYKLLQSRDL